MNKDLPSEDLIFRVDDESNQHTNLGAPRHLAHGVSPIGVIFPLDLKHALTITLDYSKRMERLQRLARAIQKEG